METYKVKQIKPNHADHISNYNDKFLANYFKELCLAQLKYDGERMLIHLDFENNEVYCTSRRISIKTNRFMENQERIPVLQSLIEQHQDCGHKYCVLDCECYAKDWSTAASILHSLPERAAELQKVNELSFAVFDCIYYDDIDISDKPYSERLSYAVNLVTELNFKRMHIVDFIDYNMKAVSLLDGIPMPITCEADWKQCMEAAINLGFEGIVVKSLDRSYYEKAASLKCKKFETVDVIVYDFVPGRGKYTGTIGALKVGYFDPTSGHIVHISNVNCSTDAERNAWRDNWETRKLSVIEVLCQEVTDKSLRHPRYVRRRDDKSYNMCTKDTIFK